MVPSQRRQAMTDVVLVTGGASGIGAAVARRFAAAGAQVVIADANEPGGVALADAIGARFVRADVAIEADNEAMVDAAVRTFGRLDIVHLNAGVGGTGVGDSFDLMRYRRVMAVNLDGTTFGIRAASRVMSKAGAGAIVVTSSLAGIAATPFDPVYAATKHAVIGLVRSVAGAWAAAGSKVTLNALCPGFVRTSIMPDEAWQQVAAMGYAIADATEIAATVEFIARDGRTGMAWIAQAGRKPQLVEFPQVDVVRT